MLPTDPTGVFVKDDVQYPMQTVLNVPVTANDALQTPSISWQARQIVLDFFLGLVGLLAATFYLDQTPQTGPEPLHIVPVGIPLFQHQTGTHPGFLTSVAIVGLRDPFYRAGG